MIYDTFIFFNELDLLELRLREMESVADRFVLAESNKTFRGESKPMFFNDNASRFAAWMDRIIYVPVFDMPDGDDPWKREHHQREAIRRFLLNHVAEDDVILLSDADEIPHARQFKEMYRLQFPPVVTLHMRAYYYYLNCRDRWDWFSAKAFRGAVLKAHTMFQLRHYGIAQNAIIPDCGWHFTYMGGVDRIHQKVRAFSHWNEPSAEPMLRRFREMPPEVAEADRLRIVPIDDSFPACVRNNEAYWRGRGYLK